MSQRRVRRPRSVEPTVERVLEEATPPRRLMRLLLVVSLLLWLGSLGQQWPLGLDLDTAGEPVAVAAVEILPAGNQSLLRQPLLPPPPLEPTLVSWAAQEDEPGTGPGVPRKGAAAQPWLREWRSVALLR